MGNKYQISASIPEDLYIYINKKAKQQDRSISYIINQMLESIRKKEEGYWANLTVEKGPMISSKDKSNWKNYISVD